MHAVREGKFKGFSDSRYVLTSLTIPTVLVCIPRSRYTDHDVPHVDARLELGGENSHGGEIFVIFLHESAREKPTRLRNMVGTHKI